MGDVRRGTWTTVLVAVSLAVTTAAAVPQEDPPARPAVTVAVSVAVDSPAPFGAPLWLLWIDRQGTLSGPVEVKAYRLWLHPMDAAGHVTADDGAGGVVHYEGRTVAGPFGDSAAACTAMAAVGVASLPILNGTGVVDCASASITPPSQASPSQPSQTTAPAVPSPTGVPLCTEVLALAEGWFAAAGSPMPSSSSLRYDGATLLGQLQDAVARHDASHPAARAYTTDTVLGEVGAAAWLATEGGIPPTSAVYVTGKERALYDGIIQAVRQRHGTAEPRLTPGEVFELALDVNAGAVPDSLLTAHNLLRAQARADTDAAAVPTTGVAFFADNLVPLRDGDSAGPWYHLFGTAYFELKVKGDWAPTAAMGVGAWTALQYAAVAVGTTATAPASGPALLALAAAAYLWQRTGSVSETSGASRFANTFEQAVRTQLMGSRNRIGDAEKFCINVWGAQIGRALYASLPYRSTRNWRERQSSLPAPDATTGTPSTGLLPLTDGGRSWPEGARYVTVVGSPFSMWFDAGDQTMLLEQGSDPATARLMGHVDGLVVFPYPEADSWGVAFAGGEESLQRVLFQPSRAAALHITRIDLASGRQTSFEITPPKGSQVMYEVVGDHDSGHLADPVGNPVTGTSAALPPVSPADAAGWVNGLVADEPLEGSGTASAVGTPVTPGTGWLVAGLLSGLLAVLLVTGLALLRRRGRGRPSR